MPPAPPAAVERLVCELGVPPLLAAVLWHRGIRENATAHLNPPLVPTTIPQMAQAAAQLEEAIRRQQRILIHGDYDADGISGTALLLLGLRSLGARVEAFIPERLSDGYGVHPERLAEHARRCDLFITVDCGISNADEVAVLREQGVEVIVTDHHQPGSVLPDCLIVHPAMSPHARPGLPELTGAGVAYHLLWALHERLKLDSPVEYSDLATIGTIADVAPLLGENRALVQVGLKQIESSRWPGLRASMRQSRLRGTVTARDVAFVLAPRLNAAGRLGEAEKGLELLVTASERRARELAAYLDARNQDRRKIQDEMFDQALAKVDSDSPALVLDDDDWHPGVMGIVASKLVERFYKPVFIVAKGKGSVRSTPGISAVEALRFAGEHLKRFGGHAQAAGFAIDPGCIGDFRDAIIRFAAGHPAPAPSLAADAVVGAAEVDAELFRAMDALEPYGEGHPAPLLALSDRLEFARAVGKDGATLQLQVAGLRGVAWRKGKLAATLTPGDPINAAVSLKEREWQGKRRLEFVAEEIRPLEHFSLSMDTRQSLTGAEVRQARVFRGPASADRSSHVLTPSEEQSGRVLHTFPIGDDPLRVTKPVSDLLESAAFVRFDLSEHALVEISNAAALLPTVADVRNGFVSIQRGVALSSDPRKDALIRQVLLELDLLDPLGRVRRGEKRDPHSSPTMVRALMERYKLNSFINAYRAFDDHGFSLAVTLLLAA